MINDFKALTMQELCERICENKKTLIIFHARPDGDAVGSAFALRELLYAMDIQSVCLCDDEVPERLRFLSESVQGSVVPEADLKFGHERVISVDSAAPSQLGNIFSRLLRNVDIMIDHHATGTPYADNYIDTSAAATGEIIYLLAAYLVRIGKIKEIPRKAINCMYAAISSDTGGFKYSNTTPRTHMVAAKLIELGADAAEINRRLFDLKSVAQIRAEGEAARRLKVFDEGRIAVTTVPYSAKMELDISDDDLGTIIEIPRSVSTAEVAISIRQPEEKGFFRVSMRSNSDIDVAKICAVFGGGGHIRAAGCSLEAENIGEALDKVLTAVRKELNI